MELRAQCGSLAHRLRLQQRLARLALENAQLRKESKYLRGRVKENSRVARIARRAFDDATRILHFRNAGLVCSRRNMLLDGMSERRWHYALGLLRLARLGDFVPDDLHELDRALQRLETRYKQLLQDEDLTALKARMPRKFRW